MNFKKVVVRSSKGNGMGEGSTPVKDFAASLQAHRDFPVVVYGIYQLDLTQLGLVTGAKAQAVPVPAGWTVDWAAPRLHEIDAGPDGDWTPLGTIPALLYTLSFTDGSKEYVSFSYES